MPSRDPSLAPQPRTALFVTGHSPNDRSPFAALRATLRRRGGQVEHWVASPATLPGFLSGPELWEHLNGAGVVVVAASAGPAVRAAVAAHRLGRGLSAPLFVPDLGYGLDQGLGRAAGWTFGEHLGEIAPLAGLADRLSGMLGLEEDDLAPALPAIRRIPRALYVEPGAAYSWEAIQRHEMRRRAGLVVMHGGDLSADRALIVRAGAGHSLAMAAALGDAAGLEAALDESFALGVNTPQALLPVILWANETVAQTVSREAWRRALRPRDGGHYALIGTGHLNLLRARGGVLAELAAEWQMLDAPPPAWDVAAARDRMLRCRQAQEGERMDARWSLSQALMNDRDLLGLMAGDVTLSDPLEAPVFPTYLTQPSFWLSGIPYHGLPGMMLRILQQHSGVLWAGLAKNALLDDLFALHPPERPDEVADWASLLTQRKSQVVRHMAQRAILQWPVLPEGLGELIVRNFERKLHLREVDARELATVAEVLYDRLPDGQLRATLFARLQTLPPMNITRRR